MASTVAIEFCCHSIPIRWYRTCFFLSRNLEDLLFVFIVLKIHDDMGQIFSHFAGHSVDLFNLETHVLHLRDFFFNHFNAVSLFSLFSLEPCYLYVRSPDLSPNSMTYFLSIFALYSVRFPHYIISILFFISAIMFLISQSSLNILFRYNTLALYF